MTSNIKHKNIKHKENDSIFKIEYFIVNDKVEYKFDVDVNNYGYAILNIYQEDEDASFIEDCAFLEEFGILVNFDSSLNINEKLEAIQNHIGKFCKEWNMINDIAK
jgi:hypothetical protein